MMKKSKGAKPETVQAGGVLSSAWTPEEVRDLRKSLGQDQTEFAALLGVDVRTLIGWETPRDNYRGPAGPAVEALLALREQSRRLSPQRVAQAITAATAISAGAPVPGLPLAGAIAAGVLGPVGAGLGVLIALGIQKLLESPKKGK